jgi:hypothetical protein
MRHLWGYLDLFPIISLFWKKINIFFNIITTKVLIKLKGLINIICLFRFIRNNLNQVVHTLATRVTRCVQPDWDYSLREPNKNYDQSLNRFELVIETSREFVDISFLSSVHDPFLEY